MTTAPPSDVLQADVLQAVDALQPAMLELIAQTVRIPSISGTDAENDGQAHMADTFRRAGLDVDHWRIDLDALTADPEFPGMEVPRTEAWGLVGRRAGTGDGATLMLNGHIDVVPIGDPDAWHRQPFAAQIGDGRLFGRGACDMKAVWPQAHLAVQASWGGEGVPKSLLALRDALVCCVVIG